MEQPLIIRQKGTTDAGTAVNLLAPVVPPGQMWKIRGVALYNNSGETVTIAFGVTLLGDFIPIGAQQTVDNGDCYSDTAWMIIREGERFGVQVTGSADKGPVTLIGSGVIYDGDPWPVVIVEPKK